MRNKIVICILFLSHTLVLFPQTPLSITELHRLIDQSESKDKIDYLIELSDTYRYSENRNLDSASYYAQKAVALSKIQKQPSKHIDALYVLAATKVQMERYDEAISHLKQVISESQKISYGIGEREGYLGIGAIYVAKQEFFKGLPYYEKAYELAVSNNEDEAVIFDMINRLTLQYKNVFEYKKGSELLEKAIPLLDHPSISLDDRSLFHINTAQLYSFLKDSQKSFDHYKRALNAAEQAENITYQAVALANLSDLSRILIKNYQRAKKYGQRMLELVDQNALPNIFRGHALYHLGAAEYYLQEYAEAIDLLEASLEILPGTDVETAADAYMSLGQTYEKVNQTQQARVSFENASEQYLTLIRIYKNDEVSKLTISDAFGSLSRLDSMRGDFKNSLKNYKLYTAYKDSAVNETNIKITERLDFLKETTKKDKEISQLALANSKQRSQQITLIIALGLTSLLLAVLYNRFRLKQKSLKIIREKNEENELLMREVHHRVKNNLQIILSLLNAQIDGHRDNEELKATLGESCNKIQSMAIIHNTLYQGNEFTKVSVDSYLRELINNLKKSFEKDKGKVQFDLDIDQNEILMALAVPLGLILNELITNSFKYAFTLENSEADKRIKITFKQTEEPHKFRLMIEDNGQGLSESFDINNLTSFGLQLVNGLVSQLNGKMEVYKQPGTTFDIFLEEPTAI